MKKYKHKKTGNIVTLSKQPVGEYKYVDSTKALIPAWMVEDSSDWEIINTDYVIQSFKYGNGNIWTRGVDELFRWDGCSEHDEAYLLDIGYYMIYSVKRLSDGEIFTVGDDMYYNNQTNGFTGGKCPIERFTLKADGRIYVNSHYHGMPEVTITNWIKVETLTVPIGTTFILGLDLASMNDGGVIYTAASVHGNDVTISWLENGNKQRPESVTYTIKQVNDNFNEGSWVKYKKKEKILTTEDGVDIFPGMHTYCTKYFPNDGSFMIPFKGNSPCISTGILHFSTLEKAIDYVYKNTKVLISFQDVLDHMYINECATGSKLLDLFKSKIDISE